VNPTNKKDFAQIYAEYKANGEQQSIVKNGGTARGRLSQVRTRHLAQRAGREQGKQSGQSARLLKGLSCFPVRAGFLLSLTFFSFQVANRFPAQ